VAFKKFGAGEHLETFEVAEQPAQQQQPTKTEPGAKTASSQPQPTEQPAQNELTLRKVRR